MGRNVAERAGRIRRETCIVAPDAVHCRDGDRMRLGAHPRCGAGAVLDQAVTGAAARTNRSRSSRTGTGSNDTWGSGGSPTS